MTEPVPAEPTLLERAPAVRPTVAVARTEAEREAVYRLRYQVSVAEMKKKLACVDHARGTLADDLDDGERSSLLFAEADGRVVATVRVSWGAAGIPERYRNDFALDCFSDFGDEAFSFTSRLVVAPQWRGTNVLGLLLEAAYTAVRDRGVRFDFCHCAPSLVSLYEQLGHRRYRSNIVDPEVGYHVPMVLLIEDFEHLRAVRSPFIRAARRYANPAETGEWFRAKFPDYASQPILGWRSEPDFLPALTQAIHRVGVPLFAGISGPDVEKFLKAATVLRCSAGDPIIRQGDVGQEMFAILSGTVEVRRVVEGASRPVTLCSAGDVFGELAFLSARPRSADVVALTDLEVLVLSQRQFRRLMEVIPEVTIKVLFNLSLVLCERLEASTQRWAEAQRFWPASVDATSA